MDINSTSSALKSNVASLYNTQQAQQVNRANTSEPEKKPSQAEEAVKTSFSSQAQQLAKAEQNNLVKNEAQVVTRTDNAVSSRQQTPGIDFISGNRKGGHVNTFA